MLMLLFVLLSLAVVRIETLDVDMMLTDDDCNQLIAKTAAAACWWLCTVCYCYSYSSVAADDYNRLETAAVASQL